MLLDELAHIGLHLVQALQEVIVESLLGDPIQLLILLEQCLLRAQMVPSPACTRDPPFLGATLGGSLVRCH